MKKMMLVASTLLLLTVGSNIAADEEVAAPKTLPQVTPATDNGVTNGAMANTETPSVQQVIPLTKTEDASVTGEATKWVDQTKKLGEAAWDASKKAAGEAGTATKKTAGEVYDATKEKSSAAWKATKEAAGNIYDTTKEEAAKAYESVKSK
ncbi:MAG: hypothetical protein GY814_16420 [Gammaproteobacteria bacterium]|nr:hypothetical protein [Gammaproteobacteria bacterium]